MSEFAQPQIGDGAEVGQRSEAPGGRLGVLRHPVYGLYECVAAGIDYAV